MRKTLEIEAAVCAGLKCRHSGGQSGEAENLINGFENAMMDGETPKEWQEREIGVAATSIRKLLVERYEIAEQILDIREPI